MLETIYIVTSGDYSDYHIKAIFKDEEKAKFYCSCHRDCAIEEYDFCDDEVFTPFNCVSIRFCLHTDRKDEIYFSFERLVEEEDKFYLENRDSVTVYSNTDINISLYRRLPNNYNEEKIKEKYTKVYYDLRAEIIYLTQGSDCSSYSSRKALNKSIENYISGRFGLEM